MSKFQSATLVSPQEFQLSEIELTDPRPGEVRVRLEGSGLCGSNLPVWQGRPWFQYPLERGSPGHEGWGRIDALGENVSDLRMGDRVAVLSTRAFAQYDTAPAANVVKLPPELNKMPCPGEALGCAANVIERCAIKSGQTVAIVGIGFLGALLISYAKGAGAHVIAINRRPFALEMAKFMGADEAVVMGDSRTTASEVMGLTQGKGCDCVIEATGHQEALDIATEITTVRGRLVIAGYHQDGLRHVNMQLWNWRGLDVINAHERDSDLYVAGMRKAIECIARGAIDPMPLYTHSFTLDQINIAFHSLHDRPEGFIKALLIYD